MNYIVICFFLMFQRVFNMLIPGLAFMKYKHIADKYMTKSCNEYYESDADHILIYFYTIPYMIMSCVIITTILRNKARMISATDINKTLVFSIAAPIWPMILVASSKKCFRTYIVDLCNIKDINDTMFYYFLMMLVAAEHIYVGYTFIKMSKEDDAQLSKHRSGDYDV